jgi:hypothetical protein
MENVYQRKVGFFGSVKQLGVTTISGANDVTIDIVGITTDLTGGTRMVTSVARQAIGIWGEDLLEDLQSDREVNRIHRQIDRIQQEASLDALRAQLSKAQASRPVGRPSNTKA